MVAFLQITEARAAQALLVMTAIVCVVGYLVSRSVSMDRFIQSIQSLSFIQFRLIQKCYTTTYINT